MANDRRGRTTQRKDKNPRTSHRRRRFRTPRYTYATIYKDRKYGFYWYAWLWKFLRPIMIALCAILLVIGLIGSGWNSLYNHYLAAPDPTNEETPGFTVRSGQSVSSIGKELVEAGYIHSASAFKYYVQFNGLTHAIQSGIYYISKSMSLTEIIQVITSGEATNERTIRIIPGWTCEDIADYLVRIGALSDREVFLAECKDIATYRGYSLALMRADETGTLDKRTYPLEGYLAPDTYRIYLSASASDIVVKLLRQTDTVLDRLFPNTNRYDENGNLIAADNRTRTFTSSLTSDETIILASIIEKEASTPEDMKRVSAVFHNRLAAGMKLESDPTATYLTGTTRLALTQADTSVRTLYNTYVIGGLPIGSICNPSANALMAALEPDMTYIDQGYLFFCAGTPGTGELVFAKTNAEHTANVAKYRPLWEAYDRAQAVKVE